LTYHEPIKKRGKKPRDITGERFGKLTALRVVADGDGNGPIWLLACDCGGTTTNRVKQLNQRENPSCGCARFGPRGPYTTKDGRIERIRLRSIFGKMRSRCYKPSVWGYKNYGGRGIRICDEWYSSTKTFVEWAQQSGYQLGLQIDRIDNNGNYEPSNCRWVDAKTNNRNRRSTVITYDIAKDIKDRLFGGQRPCDIAKELGLKPHIIYNIKNNGAWGDDPKNYYKSVDYRPPSYEGKWTGEIRRADGDEQ
jgi:hypothetical protein